MTNPTDCCRKKVSMTNGWKVLRCLRMKKAGKDSLESPANQDSSVNQHSPVMLGIGIQPQPPIPPWSPPQQPECATSVKQMVSATPDQDTYIQFITLVSSRVNWSKYHELTIIELIIYVIIKFNSSSIYVSYSLADQSHCC